MRTWTQLNLTFSRVVTHIPARRCKFCAPFASMSESPPLRVRMRKPLNRCQTRVPHEPHLAFARSIHLLSVAQADRARVNNTQAVKIQLGELSMAHGAVSTSTSRFKMKREKASCRLLRTIGGIVGTRCTVLGSCEGIIGPRNRAATWRPPPLIPRSTNGSPGGFSLLPI